VDVLIGTLYDTAVTRLVEQPEPVPCPPEDACILPEKTPDLHTGNPPITHALVTDSLEFALMLGWWSVEGVTDKAR
jgi:hypothetical protein